MDAASPQGWCEAAHFFRVRSWSLGDLFCVWHAVPVVMVEACGCDLYFEDKGGCIACRVICKKAKK